MTEKGKPNKALPMAEGGSCCRVESLISVDERGQMVLPKDIRERAGIGPGEKLAVVSWEQGGKVCCISLVKAAALTQSVHSLLGPMMEELAPGRSEQKGGGASR